MQQDSDICPHCKNKLDEINVENTKKKKAYVEAWKVYKSYIRDSNWLYRIKSQIIFTSLCVLLIFPAFGFISGILLKVSTMIILLAYTAISIIFIWSYDKKITTYFNQRIESFKREYPKEAKILWTKNTSHNINNRS